MKEEDLKKLIEKYYSGDSTGEEERTLRDYFNNDKIFEGYETEKEIFSYYSSSSEIPEPSIDFEKKILAAIDTQEMRKESPGIRKYLFPALSAAAGLLILAGSYFFFTNRSESSDTFKDPEIAYAETVKILRDISSQLNHGALGLEPVGKLNELTNKSFVTINKSTRMVERNLKNLDYLQKAIEIMQIPE